MKLVQLIRPLFLTAVGLHALMLFVPIGPTEPEEAVIEDVAFESLSDKTPEPSASALPVPDPNVSTRTATAAGKTPASRSATAVATPASRPPAALTRRATRTASPATMISSSPSANSALSPNTATAPATASPSTAPSTSSRQAADSSRPAADSGQGTNFIAALDEEAPDPGAGVQSDQSSPSSSASDSSSSGGGSNTPLSLGDLLSDVTQQIPNSLRTFASQLNRSLTYSAKNTDEESATQAREDWQENIQKQANIGQIERFPAAEITELTQIEYPIESSIEAEGQLLNRCLEKDPHSAEIGVLFDAQGNVVDQPTVLRSTGYGALNEEIKAIVAAYDDFPNDRASKAYAFEVDVFYDSETCVSLDTLKDK